MTRTTFTQADAERFWSKVDASGDCWEWTGGRANGYGSFRLNGKTVGPPRAAWLMLVGDIPPGLEIDHLCRNPPCVNPDHLEPVTRSVNQKRARPKRAESRPSNSRRVVSTLSMDYRTAMTRAALAHAANISHGQLSYLLVVDEPARTAWESARQRIKEERCASRCCILCRMIKPSGEFPKDKYDSCGIGRVCLVCHRLRMRAYRFRQ